MPRPRGLDFQKRQLSGHVGEIRVRNLVNDSRFVAIPYGRSDDRPFEDGEAFTKFYESHQANEPIKRPDLLVVRRDVFADRFPLMDPECLTLADDPDHEVAEFVDAACGAIEVKFSNSPKSKRFTIKEENLPELLAWRNMTGKSVLIAQVMPDKIAMLPIEIAEELAFNPIHDHMLVWWATIRKKCWMIPLDYGVTMIERNDDERTHHAARQPGLR